MSTTTKHATLGGDDSAAFEQSFASIAFQHIQDKAPKLLDYMVGFQLVDRNEDKTKAVGVFGFQLDKQMIFVPVFFLSGDLKGHELMYLKNQDMFVPLKENWVNYILRKKPQNLGEGVSQTVQDMGVMQPNVSQVIMPPFMSAKYSAYMASAKRWVKESGVLPCLAKLAFDGDTADDADAYFGGELTEKSSGCLELLLNSDTRYDQALEQLCAAWPGVKEALDRHYGPEFLPTRVRRYKTKQAVTRSGLLAAGPKPVTARQFLGGSLLKFAAADEPASPDVDKTQIITENSPLHDEDTRAKLLREGLLIRDARTGDEFTQQYNTQQPMSLSNPDETGVYDVLFKDGEFRKCLVITAPYSHEGRHTHATIVQLGEKTDGKRPQINLPIRKIFIRQNPDSLVSVKEWFADLPDGRAGSAADGSYVAVSPNGEGTVKFELGEDLGNKARGACFSCHCSGEDSGPFTYQSTYSDEQPSVVFDVRKGNSFLVSGKSLYIPDGAKLLEVAPPRTCQKCSKSKDKCTCSYFDAPYTGSGPKIMVGGPADLQLALSHKTAELKIQADHCDIVLHGRRLSKKAALASLVAEHGLSEPDARRFLKEAELNDVAKWRLKYAAGYPRREKRSAAGNGGMGMGGFPEPTEGGSQYGMGQMPMVDPNMGSDMPYVPVNMVGPAEQEMPVPGLESGMNDPNIYNPMLVQDPLAAQQGAQQAQQAGDPGQKEVFDTAMLSALTKVVNPDNLVDDDLPIYAKALNKLGRRLFMFFWHNESFQERYGKKDLPELEDTLRNAFEMMGDLLLYLKQKSVDTLFGTSMSNIGPNIQDASRT